MYSYNFKCCGQNSMDYDAVIAIPGCKKGKHCSEHHENYPYAAYSAFILNTVSYGNYYFHLYIHVLLHVDLDCIAIKQRFKIWYH